MRLLVALCGLCCAAVPLAAQADSVPIVSVKALAKHPKLRNHPDINYRPGVAAEVSLTYVVDTAGRVEPNSVQILAASDSGFARAARDMIRQARFTPSTYEGAPVRVHMEERVSFRADQRPTLF